MFQVDLRVAEGVNFPYYVLGREKVPVDPFTDPWVWLDPDSDPYRLFEEQHGARASGLVDVEGLWYDWLAATASDAQDSADDSVGLADEPLRGLASANLDGYVAAWPGIRLDLETKVTAALPDADVSRLLADNERLFGLSYPVGGRVEVHFSHFPSIAAQRPGPHFIIGKARLEDPLALAEVVAHELGQVLLEQLFDDPEVRSAIERTERVSAGDRYARGRWAVIEALGNVVRALDRHGEKLELRQIPDKPGEAGYQAIVRALYEHRHHWPEGDLRSYLLASLDGLVSS